MKKTLLLTLLLCLAASVAFAAGNIVGPHKCTMTWTQEPKNADNTPLTDLSGWRIFVYSTPGQPGATATATVPATAPNPAAVLNLTFDCKPLTMTEGQRYAIIKAVDLGLLESAPSAEVPFVWNAVPPIGPGGFVTQ